MKRICVLAAAAVLMAVQADGASQKRGVCINTLNQTQLDLLAPGVSWYYNWGMSYTLPTTEGVDFVPMAWSGINADAVRKYCAGHPEVKYLLGFNEPNFTNQANMTPAEAAAKWPEVQAVAKELNLKLVAPALNYSTGTYAQPTKWMDEFVALVGSDAFDFTAVHCYGGDGLLKAMVTEFYERYGKPVWVTEFCKWPGGAGNVYVSPTDQIASMIESVKWLEQSEAAFRYAWFMATGAYDAPERPNYALLTVGGTLSAPEYSLTPQGYVYTYMSTFDESMRMTEDVWHPAALCTNCNNVGFGHGVDKQTDYPLIVDRVSASTGMLEYEIELSEPGTKVLQLNLGGYGEPLRFDPTLTITATHADGTVITILDSESFTLPDTDECATVKSFLFDVAKAGMYTIRIADAGRSSGIMLGSILVGDGSGIEAPAIDAAMEQGPVDVYTVAGVRVRTGVCGSAATAGLPAGFYIVGNRKIAVR